MRLFEEWAPKGWRIQLLQRLNDDPGFYESDSDPREFLLALSSISDELDATGAILERELDVARRVWFKRFSTLTEREKLPFIEKLIRESLGISLLLLILEYLRNRNGAEYFKGAKADQSIPNASEEEIESLTELLLPNVEKRFIMRKFPVGPTEADRFFRLAHAIGPNRLEKVLEKDSELNGYDCSWAIAKAVCVGLCPQLRLDLLDLKSVGHPASDNVLKTLSQFASHQYWLNFYEIAVPQKPEKEGEIAILQHIAAGLEAAGSPLS